MKKTIEEKIAEGMSTCCFATVFPPEVCSACKEHCGTEPGVPDHDSWDCKLDVGGSCDHPIHGEKDDDLDETF